MYTLSRFLFIMLGGLWSFTLSATTALVDRDTEKGIALFIAGKQEQGLEILTLKASEGVVVAQYNLAAAWSTLEQTDLSRQETKFWLERAAQSGYGPAQFDLAMRLYEDPEDTTGREQVVYWLTEAAASGNTRAQYNLAYLAFNDAGSGVSTKTGLDWLSRAAKAGNQRARELLDYLNESEEVSPPGLYPADLEIRLRSGKANFVISRDDTAVYPIPVSRQEPIMTLAADTWIRVVEERGDWLGIRLSGGVPAWVAREELNLSGDVATVKGLEASLYVEPQVDAPVYKLGVVHTGDTLSVTGKLDHWVRVDSPDYFIAWVRKTAVQEQPGGEEQPGIVEDGEAQKPVEVLEQDDETSTPDRLTLERSHAVYSQDSRASKLLGIVSKGRNVKVVDQQNGFSRLEWNGGLEAWILGRFLEVSGDTGRVNGDRIRVRLQPNTSEAAIVVGSLDHDQMVKVTGISDDWYRVVIDDHSDGWVQNL